MPSETGVSADRIQSVLTGYGLKTEPFRDNSGQVFGFHMPSHNWQLFLLGDLPDGTFATAWLLATVAKGAPIESVNRCNAEGRFLRLTLQDNGAVEAWMDFLLIGLSDGSVGANIEVWDYFLHRCRERLPNKT